MQDIMNRVPYASDIGSISYVVIFICSNFSKCHGYWEGKILEFCMTGVVKQFSRTFWGFTKGLVACGQA